MFANSMDFAPPFTSTLLLVGIISVYSSFLFLSLTSLDFR